MSLHDARKDLRDLLNKGYDKKSAMNFIGNHYRLDRRQRAILSRTTYSNEVAEATRSKEVFQASIVGQELFIDTYNVIITLESVLFDDPLVCDDGVVRDVRGAFGRYCLGERTIKALEKINDFFKASSPAKASFLIDRQVSKSGELASLIRESQWAVDIETALSESVDHDLRGKGGVVATADYGIIQYVDRFIDIPKYFLLAW